MLDTDELLFVVDEHNNPIEPKARREVHEKHYWHRTVHIWIINDKKQLLCQKRSLLKDSNPGWWESFFGGHMEAGTEYVEGALRELTEETGISLNKDALNFFEIFKYEHGQEFQAVYYVLWNGSIDQVKIEKDEIDHVEWISLDAVKEILFTKKDPTWTLIGYEREMIDTLQKL